MTRRNWIAAASTVFAISCRRGIGSGYPGYALIATAGEKAVSVVDLDEFRLFKQVPVDGFPEAILADGAGKVNYVLTPSAGSVHAIDSNFNRALSRKLADDLRGFGLTRDGKQIWAIAGASRELIEVDGRTLQAGKRWKLPKRPAALDVSPDGSVAISTGEHGTVELLDAPTGERTTCDLGGPLGGLRFRADGKVLLVANLHEQAVTALETPSLRVIVHLPLAMQPQNLCFNSDGGQLFVTGAGMDGIAIAFPYLPLEVEQTVLAGRDPGAMACSTSPAYLFVASASGSDVCILNVDNRRMIGIVEVGQQPSFLMITPDSQYALVLNEGSNDMAVLRIASIRANTGNAAKMRAKSGAALFTMAPVGSRPVHAAIVPKAV